MNTWCIYIDESGTNENNPQFIYAAVCFPFHTQQSFVTNYTQITKPLYDYVSDKEIKYSELLNRLDRHYSDTIRIKCIELLRHFFEIEGSKIVRIKAIRKNMRAEGADLRIALFRKTLACCKEILRNDANAIILHDQLDQPSQQKLLFEIYNRYSQERPEGANFQNFVFVQSKENPCLQFADFIASVMFRYYYFHESLRNHKRLCSAAVNELFETVDRNCPNKIIELSEYVPGEYDSRREKAVELSLKHNIDISSAYNIVDGRIKLQEVLRRKRKKEKRKKRF